MASQHLARPWDWGGRVSIGCGWRQKAVVRLLYADGAAVPARIQQTQRVTYWVR